MSDTSSKPKIAMWVRVAGWVALVLGGITLSIIFFFTPTSFLNSWGIVGTAALFLIVGAVVTFMDPNKITRYEYNRGDE